MKRMKVAVLAMIALACAAGARPTQPGLPDLPSCAHASVPENAGVVATPGGFMLVHPRNADLPDDCTGCKTLWVMDVDPEPWHWATLWFRDGAAGGEHLAGCLGAACLRHARHGAARRIRACAGLRRTGRSSLGRPAPAELAARLRGRRAAGGLRGRTGMRPMIRVVTALALAFFSALTSARAADADTEFDAFLARWRAAVAANDVDAVVAMTRLPVLFEGRDHAREGMKAWRARWCRPC